MARPKAGPRRTWTRARRRSAGLTRLAAALVLGMVGMLAAPGFLLSGVIGAAVGRLMEGGDGRRR